jgi:SAM-dependent methyltransferase
VPVSVSVDRSQAFTAASVPQAYVRHLAGPLLEPWARELLALGGPWAGATVLDVACGPGTVARVAAAAVGTGGAVTASDISPAMLVWSADGPLGLFGPIAEALRDHGLPEPYPRAFEPASYWLHADELREPFVAAGFSDVSVEARELGCTWPSADGAARGVYGTPFGPLVSALAPAEQDVVLARIRERLGPGDPVTVRTVANVARASG